MKELGIYIHIPFCKKKCNYCDFISFQNINDEIVNKYIKKLIFELDKNLSNLNKEYKITTVYIGGGTPSYIQEDLIVEIMKKLKKYININDVEVTIEVNPGTVHFDKLKRYREEGINRVSIGLQSTNNETLKMLGRIHTYKMFLDTYNNAKKAGFQNINVDLMIGLPNQKIEDIKTDLENITNLKPQHISVYSLILEENTKLEEKINSGELMLPDENLEREEYWLVKSFLEKKGFKHYEISNFALKGFESKHNLNCWEQKEYIGLGIAAHSYIDDIRYSNTEQLKDFIENDKLKKEIHEKQSKEDKMKEYMLLGLRKIEGVRISDFKNKHIENPLFCFKNEINELTQKGLLKVNLDTIHLTDKGIDFANLVWEKFV